LVAAEILLGGEVALKLASLGRPFWGQIEANHGDQIRFDAKDIRLLSFWTEWSPAVSGQPATPRD
jgi:hypothetical protein